MKKILALIITLMIITINFCGCAPSKDELIKSSLSPSGQYVVVAYRNLGNATVDYSVICDVVNLKDISSRTIYIQYHESEAELKWIDETTVAINGIELDINNDYYKSLDEPSEYDSFD